MGTRVCIGWTMVGFLCVAAAMVFATEQPGPGRSMGRSGGRGPLGKGGVSDGQTPAPDMGKTPDPSSEKGENVKQEAEGNEADQPSSALERR